MDRGLEECPRNAVLQRLIQFAVVATVIADGDSRMRVAVDCITPLEEAARDVFQVSFCLFS